MYLKRSITVNWGNLPAQEFEFGPVNLLSGGNGSGKTTSADALQTLMTAAHDTLFTYNPGQDETTQRGRGGKQVRTLASYVLGCDDGAYARPHDTDGYLAGVFHPTRGESAEPFTAIIGVRAHLDVAGSARQARQDDLLFFIVPGEMLSLSHFVRSYSDGRHVVPLSTLPALLKQEFGAQNVEIYDKKRAYLGRLYGALRGRRDAVSYREARHAARSFASFMAYKPVSSIDQFVAEEVLEKKELGDTIRKVGDLLRTVHGMEEEARSVAESVAVLERSRGHADRYIDDWLQRAAAIYGAAAQEGRVNQRRYLGAKDQQARQRGKLEELRLQQQLDEERLRLTHQELVQLEARRQGVAVLKTKDELEQQQHALMDNLRRAAPRLLQENQQADHNVTALANIAPLLRRHSLGQALPALENRGWQEDSQALLALRNAPRPDLQQLLAKDWVDLNPLEEGLNGLIGQERLHNRVAERIHAAEGQAKSLFRQIEQLADARARHIEESRRVIEQSEQRIALLESRRVTYPAYVDAALAAIRQHCPQADPRVLCDHVEVSDPLWQMAIEGYIGGARFSILVEPEYEAEAVRIVRSLSGKNNNRARVIQGERARRDAERLSLPADSIMEVMRCDHKIAEYYLRASYGSVLRVKDAQTLRQTARGITPDGIGSGNYSMWRCDLRDEELVFGQGARTRALAAERQNLEALYAAGQAATLDYQAAQQLCKEAERIRPLNYVAVVEEMLSAQRRLHDIDKQLENLDLSEHHYLEEQLALLNARHRELSGKIRAMAAEFGGVGEQLGASDAAIERLAQAMDQLARARDDAEQTVRQAAQRCARDAEQILVDIDGRLEAASAEIDFADEQKLLEQALVQQERSLSQAIMDHNQRVRSADTVVYDVGIDAPHSLDHFGRIAGLRAQLDNLHNRLRNNVLLEKREQLVVLRDTFNTAFVSDLCHEIYHAIRGGERILRELNEELQNHRFGTDRERFEFDWDWMPEYKEYWSFFQEVVKLPNLGDGTTLFNAELSAQAQAVRDKLLGMLLDGAEQQALRELERISDYRHYRRYDILKHPENKAPIRLSEYGTGSGGQLETPAYIIRAAAVTSAFRFNEGDSHLRMVIVDEAFMHMDETRSREVIHYLTETLGLQLIFIMPTSKSGPFMDLISNQFIFSKVPSAQAVGELNTRVLVDRQVLNRERIAQLWANHRRTIRQQAALDFMEDIG